MPAPCFYDYAIVRVVPRVERGEFVNAGVILSCAASGYLDARIELDEARLLALDPDADLAAIRAGLAAIPAICRGGAGAGALGRLSARERFHWLVAPRSSSIQTSQVHGGRCGDLDGALEALLTRMVRRPALPPRGGPAEAGDGATGTNSGPDGASPPGVGAARSLQVSDVPDSRMRRPVDDSGTTAG